MGEFTQMEKKLTEQAREVERLLGVIKSERKRVPASINEAVSIHERLKIAEDELIVIVGIDEFEKLTENIDHK